MENLQKETKDGLPLDSGLENVKELGAVSPFEEGIREGDERVFLCLERFNSELRKMLLEDIFLYPDSFMDRTPNHYYEMSDGHIMHFQAYNTDIVQYLHGDIGFNSLLRDFRISSKRANMDDVHEEYDNVFPGRSDSIDNIVVHNAPEFNDVEKTSPIDHNLKIFGHDKVSETTHNTSLADMAKNSVKE